jgi:hypothetical protein
MSGTISAAVMVGEIKAIASEVTSVKLRHPFLNDPIGSLLIGLPSKLGSASTHDRSAASAYESLGICLAGNSQA